MRNRYLCWVVLLLAACQGKEETSGEVPEEPGGYEVEIVIDAAAAAPGESSLTLFSGRLAAGIHPYGRFLTERALYELADGFSVTVTEEERRQTFTVGRDVLKARHLVVRSGASLQAAVESAEEGFDDVYVGVGTFAGPFVMREGVDVTGSWNEDFTETADYDPLVSTEGLTTILDGGGSGQTLVQPEPFTRETVWRNLRIVGGLVADADIHGAGACIRGGGVLEGCEVSGNINTGAGNCGGGIYGDTGSVVRHCSITRNGGIRGGGIFTKGVLAFSVVEKNTATDNGRGGGVSVFGGNTPSDRAILYNNIIRDNTGIEGGGIHVERYATVYDCLVTGNSASKNVGGIQTNGSYGCNIINCTVVGNTDTSTSAYAAGICCSEHGVLMNNVVFGNTAAGREDAEAVQIIVNNRYLFFFNNAYPEGRLEQKVSPWKAERHDAASDVLLAGLSGVLDDAFMPVAGSVLLDKGIETVAVSGHEDGTVPDWTASDLAGRPRKSGSALDLGCFEYQAL